MTFGTGIVQAESTAKWLILNNKGEVKEAAVLPALLAAEIENKDGSLLFLFSKTQTKILCENIGLENIQLEKEGTVTKGFQVLFNGCEVFIKNVLEKNCIVFFE